MYCNNQWKHGKMIDAPLWRWRFAPLCCRRSIRVQGNAGIQVPTIQSEKTSCYSILHHTNEQNMYRLVSTAGVPNNWNKVFKTSPKTLLAWKSPPTWDNYSRTYPTTGTLWVSWPAIPNPQNLCVHKHILAPGIFFNPSLENALCYQQKRTHQRRVLNLEPSTSSRATIRER